MIFKWMNESEINIEGDKIVDATSPNFTAQCLRVPVSNGHMGAVFVRFENKPTKEQMLEIWKNFKGLEHGMAISIGRLREDTQYDYKFVCLSHNTLRGAAGGAVLLAELLCAEGYMD